MKIDVTEVEHNGVPIHLPIFEFFELFGDNLVAVNDETDVETGIFRIFPEETDRVDRYIADGYGVVTIWEGAETDIETVTFEYEKGFDHPFVTGYFILEPLI